jgi:crotonobetainyl-CoA:carnitine CoA-transferase CaiB-like acyl-CoA transferase
MTSDDDARQRLPLAALKVLDLSSIVAGPYMGGLLADLGAEVVKVEGPQRFDPTRGGYGPFFDNDLGAEPWNRGGSYNMLNRGKRSFVCDLTTEKGRALLRSLLKWADVLIENYRPTVLEKWGLSAEELHTINPRLITMSNSGFGATGPWRNFRAQGTTLELTMGFGAVTGYRGERPSKAGQSYPDYIACWYGLTAILAALIWRERSGQGQRIDQGMYQMGTSLLAESLLTWQADGVQLERVGSADFDALVSGVFESRDQDRWVAVTVRDEADLERLSAVIPQRTSSPKAAPADEDTVQQVYEELAKFVGTMDAAAAAAALQAAGVPAGPVLDVAGLLQDRQLADRGFYEEVDFGREMGTRPLIGRPFRYSSGDGPAIARRAADFGADNEYVLEELLGLSRETINDLYQSGIVANAPVVPHPGQPADMESMVRSGAMARYDPGYREHLRSRPCG